MGEVEQAVAYSERAYRVSERIQPRTAWLAALARGEYGLALLQSGDAEQALGAAAAAGAGRSHAVARAAASWLARWSQLKP